MAVKIIDALEKLENHVIILDGIIKCTSVQHECMDELEEKRDAVAIDYLKLINRLTTAIS